MDLLQFPPSQLLSFFRPPLISSSSAYNVMYPHPYSGWREAGQGLSTAFPQSPAPSILGALPYPTISYATTLLTYRIVSSSMQVFNSKVVGPDNNVCYTISTDDEMPGYTAIKNAHGHAIALIEWKSQPMIEVRGVLSKQAVCSWLRLSPDRSARSMDVRGVKYIWAPHNQSINLHASDYAHTFIANIARVQNCLAIQVTSDAIHLKLMDSIVIAAVLLQCGRNID